MMNDDEFLAAVRAVFPGASHRSCRLTTHLIAHVGQVDATIDLDADTTWTYDEIRRLADALRTTDLRFRWEADPGYSEYTPGGPDRVTIEVRWTKEVKAG